MHEYTLDSMENSMDIYLLIGQSNMAGRANIEAIDADSRDHVYLFNGTTSVQGKHRGASN